MRTPFSEEVCRNKADLLEGRTLKTTGSEKEPHCANAANTDSDNCIACPKEDVAMRSNFQEILSNDDVLYIRSLIAEGIARALVEKVAKSSESAVDGLEPERYNPSTQKGGSEK